MPIGVVIIEISHEEIRHDFLLHQAENHTIQIVKPDFEGVKTFTLHPHISDEAFESYKQPTFIIPVFDYRLMYFKKPSGKSTLTAYDFPFGCVTTCFASTLETCLASSMRKPPKIPKTKPAIEDGGFLFFDFQV